MIDDEKEYIVFNNLQTIYFKDGGILDAINEFTRDNRYMWDKYNRDNDQKLPKLVRFLLIEDIMENTKTLKNLVDNKLVNGISSITRNIIEEFVYYYTIFNSRNQFLIAKRYAINHELKFLEKAINVTKQDLSEIKIEYNFLLKEWEKIKPTGFSKKKEKILKSNGMEREISKNYVIN